MTEHAAETPTPQPATRYSKRVDADAALDAARDAIERIEAARIQKATAEYDRNKAIIAAFDNGMKPPAISRALNPNGTVLEGTSTSNINAVLRQANRVGGSRRLRDQ